ncbi:MAG TPA: helix-turn-helix domain-containing protein [Thermoanaerobaculia bacterium]
MTLSLLSARAGEPLRSFQEALRAADEATRSLGAEGLVEALGEAEKLKARLSARLFAEGAPHPVQEDRLLTVEEAAARLAISTDTLYRKAREMPFTVRIGGNVRFSAQGLSRYLATRQGR